MIVQNVSANIPVTLSWLLLPFLAVLCFAVTAQFTDSSLYWPNGLIQFLCKSEAALVCSFVIQHRENENKDTGMFAFTFSAITSFPATHGFLCRKGEHEIKEAMSRHVKFLFASNRCAVSYSSLVKSMTLV